MIKKHVVTLIFFAGFGLTLNWQWSHQSTQPTFRGVPATAPEDMTPEQYADEIVDSVDALRASGKEPDRYLFELPQDWDPPHDWTPPEGWTPPHWFP